ncbi:hypothetical protein JB92DRAFT_3175831, partial [Gautieria morchelliformis]
MIGSHITSHCDSPTLVRITCPTLAITIAALVLVTSVVRATELQRGKLDPGETPRTRSHIRTRIRSRMCTSMPTPTRTRTRRRKDPTARGCARTCARPGVLGKGRGGRARWVQVWRRGRRRRSAATVWAGFFQGAGGATVGRRRRRRGGRRHRQKS